MQYKDYYSTLGVSRDASQDEIQKAYRKMARRFHPDVNRGAEAEDKFKEVSEAYEVLKDKDRRSTYDRYGKDGRGFENVRFDFGEGFGGSGFSSFFEMLFGNRGGGGPAGSPFGGGQAGSPFGGGFQDFSDFSGRPRAGGRGPSRGQDHTAKIALTLEEAAQGGQREITVADMMGQSKTYSIAVPTGIKPGQKIRLQGRGSPSLRGGPPGDLFLQVDLKPHERFRLEGTDLHTHLPVSPWEAALGTEVPVRTLGGSIKVRIPAGSSSGRKIRLRGKGFPAREGTGDLYAEIRVTVPDELTPREKELFEELARESSYRPSR